MDIDDVINEEITSAGPYCTNEAAVV